MNMIMNAGQFMIMNIMTKNLNKNEEKGEEKRVRI